MLEPLRDHPRVVALAVFAAAVLSAGLAYTYWPTPPPAMPETMADVPRLLESRAYANLSRDERRPYVQRVSELMAASDRDERRAVMSGSEQSRDAFREGMRQMMLDRAKQFALADPATREQMIRQDRALFQQMRGRGGPGGPGGRDRNPSGDTSGRGDRPELSDEEKEERREKHETMIEQWVNEGNGQEWALMREYMQQVRPPRD
ncbi:MAG: hypothetical protein ACPGYV_02315 [Phycisphaeraceae bacterium]